MDLSSAYFGQGHHVYCDNFFTSVVLLRHLLNHQIYACGTIRSNRKFFPIDGAQALQHGGFVSQQDAKNPNIVATSWKDNKVVTAVSSMCSPEETATVMRRLKNGSRIELPCPLSIYLYNKYLGGVDKGDQLRKYYQVRMKSTKYYKYIFWFMVDVCVTNSFILSHLNPRSNLTVTESQLKAFRLQLADDLIETYMSRRRAGRSRSTPLPVVQVSRSHMPVRGQKRRCCHCKKKGVRHETMKAALTCHHCASDHIVTTSRTVSSFGTTHPVISITCFHLSHFTLGHLLSQFHPQL